MKILGSRVSSYIYIAAIVLCLQLVNFSMAFAEEFRYDSHGRRDPFISPADLSLAGGGQLGHSELHLEGVIVDERGGSYAIVNNQIVKEGEVFEGFTLKKIEPNQAIFEKNGENFELVLRQEDEIETEAVETEKAGN